jgi:glycosyltransferase involved in cell wall biosynthesis
VLVDARVNGMPGAHGLARSVLKLTAHLPHTDADLAVQVLVNPRREQLFPLSELPAHVEVIGTDITAGEIHRCRELARLVRAADPAVLWVPYPTFVPVIRPCPIVVTLHDTTVERSAAFAGSWHRRRAMRAVTSLALSRAAATTTPTRTSLADVRRHYPHAPRLTVVPNGVDVGQFGHVDAAAVAAARRAFRLPERFVLTVGAHRPHKNQQTLVRALATLPEAVSLVIVGPGDPAFLSPLPALIRELGLAARVLLLPEVPDEWLPAIYRAARVFAFPSLAEGYGIPVLEAMAAGVPAVVSDIPVLTEVTGSAALSVAPLDTGGWATAITKILDDPGLAADLAAEGRATAAAATWEHGAQLLADLLASVADG